MKRWLKALVTAMFALAAAAAGAQDQYPSKPIRFIVPFGAGGVTDVLARLLAPEFTKDWGQPVVVENKTGATAIIGTEFVARSAPDGYTILVTSNAHTINPALRPQMPFDSVRDFTPLTLLAASPNVLLVRVESPIKTVTQYVAAAKARPGVVSTATSGVGTSLHILSAQFSHVAGMQLNHIPYTNSAQSVGALLGGQVDSSWNAINAALPHIKSGKLRALAVASGKRSSFLPDLVTFEEAGFKGVVSETWLGALAPSGLPAPIAQKLNAEFVKLINRPDIREKILALGAEPVGIELDRFAQLIRTEIADYTQTVKAANIRAD